MFHVDFGIVLVLVLVAAPGFHCVDVLRTESSHSDKSSSTDTSDIPAAGCPFAKAHVSTTEGAFALADVRSWLPAEVRSLKGLLKYIRALPHDQQLMYGKDLLNTWNGPRLFYEVSYRFDGYDGKLYQSVWGKALDVLPFKLKDGTVQQYLRDHLQLLNAGPCGHGLPEPCLPDRYLSLAMTTLSYLRQAYRYAPSSIFADSADYPSGMPESLAAIETPLKTVAERLGRASDSFTWSDMFTNNAYCQRLPLWEPLVSRDLTRSLSSLLPQKTSGRIYCTKLPARFSLIAKFAASECERIFGQITVTQTVIFGRRLGDVANILDEIVSIQARGYDSVDILHSLDRVSEDFSRLRSALHSMSEQFDIMTTSNCPPIEWWNEVGVWAQAPPGEYGPNGLQFLPVLVFDFLLGRTDRFSDLGQGQLRNIALLPRHHQAILYMIESAPARVPAFVQNLREVMVSYEDMDESLMDESVKAKAHAIFRVISSYNDLVEGFHGYLAKHLSKASEYISQGTLHGKPRGTSGNTLTHPTKGCPVVSRVMNHGGGGDVHEGRHDSEVIDGVVERTAEMDNTKAARIEGVGSRYIKCRATESTPIFRTLSAALVQSMDERKSSHVYYSFPMKYVPRIPVDYEDHQGFMEVDMEFLPIHEFMWDFVQGGMLINIFPGLFISSEPNSLYQKIWKNGLEHWGAKKISPARVSQWRLGYEKCLAARCIPPDMLRIESDESGHLMMREEHAAMVAEIRPLGKQALNKLIDSFEGSGDLGTMCIQKLESLNPDCDWGDVMQVLPEECQKALSATPSVATNPVRTRMYSIQRLPRIIRLTIQLINYMVKYDERRASKAGLVTKVLNSDKNRLLQKRKAVDDTPFESPRPMYLDPLKPFVTGPLQSLLSSTSFDVPPLDSNDGWFYTARHTRRMVIFGTGSTWTLLLPTLMKITDDNNCWAYDVMIVILARSLRDVMDLNSLYWILGRPCIRIHIGLTRVNEDEKECDQTQDIADYIWCRKRDAKESDRGFDALNIDKPMYSSVALASAFYEDLARVIGPRYTMSWPTRDGTWADQSADSDNSCYPDITTTVQLKDTALYGLVSGMVLRNGALAGPGISYAQKREIATSWVKDHLWRHPRVTLVGSGAFSQSVRAVVLNALLGEFADDPSPNISAEKYIQRLFAMKLWAEEANGSRRSDDSSPTPRNEVKCSDLESMSQTNKLCVVAFYGSVYDISEYVRSGVHPGGSESLKSVCGKDMTEEFSLVGHSLAAVESLYGMAVATLVNEDKDIPKSRKLNLDLLVDKEPVHTCVVRSMYGHGRIIKGRVPSEERMCKENDMIQLLVIGKMGVSVSWHSGEGLATNVVLPLWSRVKKVFVDKNAHGDPCIYFALLTSDASGDMESNLEFCPDSGYVGETDSFTSIAQACLNEVVRDVHVEFNMVDYTWGEPLAVDSVSMPARSMWLQATSVVNAVLSTPLPGWGESG